MPSQILLQNVIKHALLLQNEVEIGEAVRQAINEGVLRREDVYITSKVSPYEQGSVAAHVACKDILHRLDLQYVDLVLIHWPGIARTSVESPVNATLRLETWRVLEEFHKRGLFRAIGVSNYEQRHLQELLACANVHPAVNQIECHPRWPQESLRKFCAENDVAVEAYASFGTGALLAQGIEEVTAVANRTGKTTAQVLLCWGLQKGMTVLPKSSHPHRIAEFLPDCPGMLPCPDDGRFLSVADEALLDSLAQKSEKYCWDPSKVV